MGELSKVKIVYQHGRSKGKAFVEYLDQESANRAVLELNGKELEGRELIVEYQGQSLNTKSSSGYENNRQKTRHYDREDRGRRGYQNNDNYYRSRSGRHRRSQPSKVLFVGNLGFDTRETAIEEHFEPFGKIVDVRLAYSRDGVSKGFGYVEFKHVKDSEDALHSLSGQYLDGRALKLDFDHNHDQRGEDRRTR